jgi:hypothetical protein
LNWQYQLRPHWQLLAIGERALPISSVAIAAIQKTIAKACCLNIELIDQLAAAFDFQKWLLC